MAKAVTPESFDGRRQTGGSPGARSNTRPSRRATTCRRWSTRTCRSRCRSARSSGRASSSRASAWARASTSSGPTSPPTSASGFLWAAVVGVTIQYFLNMEIERYTLATGETAVAGFARFWKPWGILFCVFTIVPNMWPGWGTAGATIFTYLVGRQPQRHRDHPAALDRGRADRVARRLQDAREGRVLQGRADDRLPGHRHLRGDQGVGVGRPAATRPRTSARIPSDEVAIATILAGLVFAGAGGANNLVQSNWIRDKGFGMGNVRPAASCRRSPARTRPAPSTGIDGAPGRGEHRALQRLVQAGHQGAARLVLGHLRGLDHRLLGARLLDRLRPEPLRRGGLRLHQGRGRGRSRTSSAPWFGTFFWVFGALSLVARGARRGRLRLAPRRRRAQDAVPARQRALEREPKIYFLRGLEHGLRRHRSSCCRASTSRSCCSCSQRA